MLLNPFGVFMSASQPACDMLRTLTQQFHAALERYARAVADLYDSPRFPPEELRRQAHELRDQMRTAKELLSAHRAEHGC
jgi:hypothetical protein